jgi:hypothetical protein
MIAAKQVERAKGAAALLTAGPSAPGAADARYDLEEKFKQLDMENYENDDDNLIARMLQVSANSPVAECSGGWPHLRSQCFNLQRTRCCDWSCDCISR